MRSMSPQKGAGLGGAGQQTTDIYNSDKEKTININFNEIEKKHNVSNDDKSQQ